MAAAIAPVFEETAWLCLFAKYPLYIDEKCDKDAISLTFNKTPWGKVQTDLLSRDNYIQLPADSEMRMPNLKLMPVLCHRDGHRVLAAAGRARGSHGHRRRPRSLALAPDRGTR